MYITVYEVYISEYKIGLLLLLCYNVVVDDKTRNITNTTTIQYNNTYY